MVVRHGVSRIRGRVGSQFSRNRSNPLRTSPVKYRYHSARSRSETSGNWSTARPARASISQKSCHACPSRRRAAASSWIVIVTSLRQEGVQEDHGRVVGRLYALDVRLGQEEPQRLTW